jgi:glutamate synthase (NADPH/NADH)
MLPVFLASLLLVYCRRGQSLIVWGINEGRQAAREIDTWLMGNTYLPVAGGIRQRSFEQPAKALVEPVAA